MLQGRNLLEGEVMKKKIIIDVFLFLTAFIFAVIGMCLALALPRSTSLFVGAIVCPILAIVALISAVVYLITEIGEDQ